jgi:hypothetical protein
VFAQNKEVSLYHCFDESFGLKILCNPDWALEEADNAFMMIISADPAVTVTVVKIDSKIRFLGQLTRDAIQEIGQYASGFQYDYVDLAGEKAYKVKALSKKYPEIRLLDYYLVHEGQLYGLLFSISPKEAWDNYQFLFKRMAESVEFPSDKDGLATVPDFELIH